MDSKIYKLSDGKIVIGQEVDKKNRLIYILENGKKTYAENAHIMEYYMPKFPASVGTTVLPHD